MLDQNTDRMWYVIGAVIIGAAIILIMNKTFPQLFASIGETFIGKTEQTTEVVDGIYPVSNPNLLLGSTNDWTNYNGKFPFAGDFGIPSKYRSLSDMGLKIGDTLTFSGEYKVASGSYAPRINFSPVPYDTDDNREKARVGKNYTGTGKFVYTVVIPEDTVYLRVLPTNGRDVDLEKQETTIVFRRLKVEKGSIATSWRN